MCIVSLKSPGFSLIELLVVIALIAVLMALAGPAVNAIKGASTLTKSAEDLKGVLEQARAHAMAKNTYVYVGLLECDEMVTSSNSPKQYGGTVVAGVAASKQGTKLTNSIITTNEANIVSRLFKLQNTIITNIDSTSGGLARPTSPRVILIDSTASTLKWPGAGAVTFSNVIEFDPQGVARRATNAAATAIDGYLEIPLMQARGGSANPAAIQVDGITGAVRIYRPGL